MISFGSGFYCLEKSIGYDLVRLCGGRIHIITSGSLEDCYKAYLEIAL